MGPASLWAGCGASDFPAHAGHIRPLARIASVEEIYIDHGSMATATEKSSRNTMKNTNIFSQ